MLVQRIQLLAQSFVLYCDDVRTNVLHDEPYDVIDIAFLFVQLLGSYYQVQQLMTMFLASGTLLLQLSSKVRFQLR